MTNDKLPSFQFRNRGDGTFEEAALLSGSILTANSHVNDAIELRLVGTKSNRDGIGAFVKIAASSDSR